MPAFNSYGALATQVASGDTVALFANTDTVAQGLVSKVISPVDSGPVGRNLIQFTISFPTAPTDAVTIYGSNTPPTAGSGATPGAPQNGIALFTSTNKQFDSYPDNLGFRFYWAGLPTYSAGGMPTVIAHVR